MILFLCRFITHYWLFLVGLSHTVYCFFVGLLHGIDFFVGLLQVLVVSW